MAECGQTILVTGVEGMIGNAVAAILRQKGRGVVGMDRRIRDAAALGVPVYEADLADAHALDGALADHPCRAIIHCGAISGPMLAPDNPAVVFSTNTQGTLNLLEAARRLRMRRFVFASSLMAYGGNDGSPLHEDSPLLARDAYGASKIAAEAMVNAYAGQYGLEGVSARLAWVTARGVRPRAPCAPCSGTPWPAVRRGSRPGAARSDNMSVSRTWRSRLSRFWKRPAFRVLPTMSQAAITGPSPKSSISSAELCPALRSRWGTPLIRTTRRWDLSPIHAIGNDIGWSSAIALPDGLVSYRNWLAHQEAP